MVINVYKLQRLAANERMAGAVAQGKPALRNSAQALPWRQILSAQPLAPLQTGSLCQAVAVPSPSTHKYQLVPSPNWVLGDHPFLAPCSHVPGTRKGRERIALMINM